MPSCAVCPAEALEVGTYAGILCVPHALVAAKARRTPVRNDRAEALRAQESVRQAFRARTRQLKDLGPQNRSSQASEASQGDAPLDRVELEAIAEVMRGLGGRFVRTEPRYGEAGAPNLPRFSPRPHGPGAACDLCGSTRTKLGLWAVRQGSGVLQVVQCLASDGCWTRLRANKRVGDAA